MSDTFQSNPKRCMELKSGPLKLFYTKLEKNITLWICLYIQGGVLKQETASGRTPLSKWYVIPGDLPIRLKGQIKTLNMPVYASFKKESLYCYCFQGHVQQDIGSHM